MSCPGPKCRSACFAVLLAALLWGGPVGCIMDFHEPPIPAQCGDGVVAAPELCDDGNAADGDGCSAACEAEPGWTCVGAPSGCTTTCSDGVRAGAEACDASDLDGHDCGSLLGFADGQLACQADCQAFDSAGCHTCGDGQVQGPEVCDGSDLNGATCASEGAPDGGALFCAGDCLTYDTSACHVCGNHVLEGPEVCDGLQPGEDDCASLPGWHSGTLACSADCLSFDTSACVAGCDNTGDCNSCATCAQLGICLTETQDCLGSIDCMDLVDCFAYCTDAACQQTCMDNHPLGVQIYAAFETCLVCQACPSDCEGALSCTGN